MPFEAEETEMFYIGRKQAPGFPQPGAVLWSFWKDVCLSFGFLHLFSIRYAYQRKGSGTMDLTLLIAVLAAGACLLLERKSQRS